MEIMWTLLSVIGIMWLYIGWIGLVTALVLRNEIDGLYTDRIYKETYFGRRQTAQDWRIYINLRIQNKQFKPVKNSLLKMEEKQEENN